MSIGVNSETAVVRPIDALRRIADAIVDLTDLPDLLQTILNETLAILGMEGGSLCMVEDDESLSLAAHQSLSDATIVDLTTKKIMIGDCLCGKVAHSLKPLILWDEAQVAKYETKESQRQELFAFHAAFPIAIRDHCLGVLCVFSRGQKKPSDEQLSLIEIICALSAVAIENAKLLAMTKETDEHVQQVYIDVIYAVTGGKMIIQKDLDPPNMRNLASTSFDICDGEDLMKGRHQLRQFIAHTTHREAKGDLIVAACEAMTNALKHAGSGVTQVAANEHSIWIRVTDNGPGIDFTDLPKVTLMRGYSSMKSLGVGFSVMLDYAEKIYLSTSKTGTDIMLVFPVGEQSAA